MSLVPHLRVARPTDRLDALVQQYREGLGLVELGRFEDHDGFDGVMLGRSPSVLGEAGYHLEFTQERGVPAGGAPSAEHLLIFYLPDAEQWSEACSRAEAAGFRRVDSHNPYWERVGRTLEDLDGYRVVLQNASWPGAADQPEQS